MKKYGLQLRPSHQKKPSSAPTAKPIRPPPAAFMDEDEDDVEMEIARQAAKNRALKDIENQHKKALEEDPSVFDYDGVYDEMKEKIAKPLIEDRKEKKNKAATSSLTQRQSNVGLSQPKYIQLMIEKAKERKIQDEIVYERKIQKERSKEDDLFANKDKYVTSAYKKKLAEWQKWNEEEKMREEREKKDEDISSFYFNIGKNVAFGGKSTEPKPLKKHGEGDSDDTRKSDNHHKPEEKASSSNAEATEQPKASVQENDSNLPSISTSSGVGTSSASDVQEKVITEKPVIDEKPKQDNHKKSEDDLAAARERYLARKRARELNYE
ncbi:hypothetical protein QJS04_geneDACA008582 [Acorus gramineus]|uniref:Nuclear speckle splicing regulatory protein 1 N-terminal domain-containing protein n=1 Tax=Acorus gramineus TaxID=55184 RepID=A0AAV9AHJ0_ACOGR|nr:hypothetical protein QJS04_geneDACA008582 [Acorus gramineus]